MQTKTYKSNRKKEDYAGRTLLEKVKTKEFPIFRQNDTFVFFFWEKK